MNHNPAHNPMCPKGYEQTEVGVIPEDWDSPELGKILISMQLGGNYKNSESETSYPLIKMGNLGRGNIKLDKLEFIDSSQKPDKRDRLKADDLLFNTRNTLDLVGKISIWRNELPEAYFNSNIARMKFDGERVSSYQFMNYIMNTARFLKDLRSIATGTTSVAAIYGRDFVKLKVPLPPKAEQEAIAGALSDADALIESLEQLITKKRHIKQGAMQELLTGKKRLPGFEIKPGYKQTEVVVIPEDWDISRLIECTDYVDYRGKTPTKSSSGVLLVTAKNIRCGFIDYEISQEFIAETEYESAMRRGKPCIGDVLITTEAPLGMVAMVDRDNIALAQRVIKYRGKINKILSNYLKFYLLSSLISILFI